MKNFGTVIVSVVLAALAAVGVVSVVMHPQVQQQPKAGGTSPVLSSPYFSYGGITSYRYPQTMQSATTTLCAILSPAATTTLDRATWTVTTGTSTAASIDIGLGSTAYATTSTLVSATALASGAQGTASYAAANGTGAIVGPSHYLLVKTNGAGLGGYTYTGKCTAQFTRVD